MSTILVTDITNATTTTDGTGIFDKLMQTSILHIEDQLIKNHLTQSEVGQVYAAMIQNAMQQAVQFVLNRPVSEAQIELYNKQRDGFDHDAKQKLLKVVMDGWSILYSSSPDGQLIPDAVTKVTLDKLVEDAMRSLNIAEVANMTDVNAIDNSYLDIPIRADS